MLTRWRGRVWPRDIFLMPFLGSVFTRIGWYKSGSATRVNKHYRHAATFEER